MRFVIKGDMYTLRDDLLFHKVSGTRDSDAFIKFSWKGGSSTYEFKSKFEPNIGEIVFEGEVMDLEDAKTTEAVLKGWKKDKKLPDELMSVVLNSILAKCNIQALVLSRDMNLPPPLKLPKVAAQK